MNQEFIKKTVTIVIILIILISCGHKKSPTGGKKDLVNPEILSIFPEEFSDISSVRQLEITFSKPIERNSIFTGAYSYPTILKKKYKWDKNTLVIKFLEDLEPDTNYFFSFSPFISGEHGNSLDQDYIFTYHTGTLNKNRISGLIEYEKPEDQNKDIRLNLFSADTTRIYSQILSGKNYILENLNYQQHLIRAFIDLDKNNVYDFTEEPFFEILIDDKPAQQVIKLAYQDTIRPHIVDAEVHSSTQIDLTLSENIIEFKDIHIENVDTLIVQPVNILAWHHDRDLISFVTSALQKVKYNVYMSGITDSKSNTTALDSILIIGTSQSDSLAPELISYKPRNGATINDLKPEIELIFSEIIYAENLTVTLTGVEDSQIIPLETSTINGTVFHFEPQQKLKNYVSYNLEINASDPWGNVMAEPITVVFIPIER